MKTLKQFSPLFLNIPAMFLATCLVAWLIIPNKFAMVATVALYVFVAFCLFIILLCIVLGGYGAYYVVAYLRLRLQAQSLEASIIRLQKGETIVTPQYARFNIIRGDTPAPIEQSQLLLPEPGQVTTLPDKVLLPDIMPLNGPNLNEIVLGVGLNGDGQAQAITAPLSKLVHVAVGGSSGWGKSVLLRSLAYQVALAPEQAELALIDLEAATFSPFARSNKLRYSIADTETDANNILVDLLGELKKRKEFYKKYPTVESLESYNLIADHKLPMIALMIDESTALLGDKTIEANIRMLALRARKYGIYAVLGGQDWKASSLDSAIRNQLSTKIQLKAQSKAQSRVLLDDAAAADIEVPGRAYAVLPGQPMAEIQTPYISLPMLMKALVDTGAMAQPAPVAEMVIEQKPPTEKQARAAELFNDGLEVNEIANIVYGRDGGKQLDLVKSAIEKYA